MTDTIVRGVVPADLAARLKTEPPDGPAVYFLFVGEECVYVGLSIRAMPRLYLYKKFGREYERAAFLPVEREELSGIEREWIIRLCPKHNKVNNPHPDDTAATWGGTKRIGSVQFNFLLDPDVADAVAKSCEAADTTLTAEFRKVLEKLIGYEIPVRKQGRPKKKLQESS